MTQLEMVKKELNENNYVSRNWALRHNITRLGALINRLNWDLEGRYNGKDYIYVMKKRKPSDEWDELNEQLKELLKVIPMKWENYEYINEINGALKSKNSFHKRNILKKIGKKFAEKSL